jgi:hypothetical protein
MAQERILHMGDLFLPQMGDVLRERVCFDTSLARGEWGMVGLAIPHSVKISAR